MSIRLLVFFTLMANCIVLNAA
ncbi:TPA: exporting protein, partial [Campylobacter coli]|nr:exporting protein [Campylobacter coli]